MAEYRFSSSTVTGVEDVDRAIGDGPKPRRDGRGFGKFGHHHQVKPKVYRSRKAKVEASKGTADPAETVETPVLRFGTSQADLVYADEGEVVQVDVKVMGAGGDVVLTFSIPRGEEWERLDSDVAQLGAEVLLSREKRLESTAARFGMHVDALLKSLEQAVVDTSDQSGGMPAAERDAFEEAGIDLSGSATDPAGAVEVLKGRSRFAEFRAEALSVTEAAALLDKSEGRVRQMISAKQLVTIPNSESGHLLPRWQFVGGAVVPGLSAILDAVGPLHPLALAGFMTRPDVDLDLDGTAVSPIDWLIAGGEVGPVAELAAGLNVLG